MRFKPQYTAVSVCACDSIQIYVCRRKAAVVLRKVVEALRFDCGQYGFFAVFAVYMRFPAVFCDCRPADNSDLNSISVNVVLDCTVVDTPRRSIDIRQYVTR